VCRGRWRGVVQEGFDRLQMQQEIIQPGIIRRISLIIEVAGDGHRAYLHLVGQLLDTQSSLGQEADDRPQYCAIMERSISTIFEWHRASMGDGEIQISQICIGHHDRC